MKLFVETKKPFSSEELKQCVDLIRVPALILDDNLKIIAKSKSFADSKSFRIGSKFDKLVRPYDRERIAELGEGKMLVVDIASDDASGYVTVIRANGCFLACFRYLADGMVERIFERLNNVSGYDVGVNAYISAVLSDVSGSENGKRISLVVNRLLAELCDVHRLSFFDFSATLSSFFSVLAEISPKLLHRIELPRIFPETVALGCGDDALLILAYALSLCADGCTGGIAFEALDGDGGIKMTLCCDGIDEGGETVALANALEGRGSFDKPLDKPTLWAFFLRLIADTNLWEIRSEIKNGRFSFSLYMPSVTRGEEFSVRDPEDFSVRSVLLCFFGL